MHDTDSFLFKNISPHLDFLALAMIDYGICVYINVVWPGMLPKVSQVKKFF